MGTLFFCFVAFLLAAYVVLDGYDLGTGLLHFFLGRDEAERGQLLATIGPVWDGNEVYLVAAGGTLFFAFPDLYAVSFSGFYLPLMIVLWLLIMRGVSVELRSYLDVSIWRQGFDALFFLSSVLLGFLLGVAMGNVVRGVPVEPGQLFLQPLWTTLRVGQHNGILDWYTVLVGVAALSVLSEEGALWAVYRTTGVVHDRARGLVPRLWIVSAVLTLLMSAATFAIQLRVGEVMWHEPWRLLFPATGILAFGVTPAFHRSRRAGLALVSWGVFLAMLLASAAFGLYPWVLPSSIDPRYSLSVEQVAAADASLRIGAVWWQIGMALAVSYTAYVHWAFSGKVGKT